MPELRKAAGAILVERDGADQTERYWFDRTPKGRIVICGIVAYCNDVRTYLDLEDVTIPSDVMDVVTDEFDVDTVYDAEGKEFQ